MQLTVSGPYSSTGSRTVNTVLSVPTPVFALRFNSVKGVTLTASARRSVDLGCKERSFWEGRGRLRREIFGKTIGFIRVFTSTAWPYWSLPDVRVMLGKSDDLVLQHKIYIPVSYTHLTLPTMAVV